MSQQTVLDVLVERTWSTYRHAVQDPSGKPLRAIFPVPEGHFLLRQYDATPVSKPLEEELPSLASVLVEEATVGPGAKYDPITGAILAFLSTAVHRIGVNGHNPFALGNDQKLVVTYKVMTAVQGEVS